MEIEAIHAICGPRCTICPAYVATRSGKAELEKVAAEWTKAMKKKFTADDIACDGCRVKNGRKSSYCSSCAIKNCAESKGHETCAHCSSCPCDKIVAPPAVEALAALRKMINQEKC